MDLQSSKILNELVETCTLREAALQFVSSCLQSMGEMGPVEEHTDYPPTYPCSIPQPCNSQINAITPIKLPQFWTNDPELWFTLFDAKIASSNISDNEMYQAVVSALRPEALWEVSSIVSSAPPQAKYNYLKITLTKYFTDATERQTCEQLAQLELGNQEPSQLLEKMRAIAGKKASEENIRRIWLSKLPSSVCQVDLAGDADEAEEAHNSIPIEEGLMVMEESVEVMAPIIDFWSTESVYAEHS